MTDWEELREVEHDVLPPAFGSLVSTARRREQRTRTAVVVGVIALVAAGIGLGSGAGDDGSVQPAEDPSNVEQTDVAPGTVLALPAPEERIGNGLPAGRYRVPVSGGLAYEIDLPEGTLTEADLLYIQAGRTVIKSEIAGSRYGIPADPCDAFGTIEPAGPTVEDLVTAIRNEPAYSVEVPQPVVIGGVVGQRLEIRIADGQDTSDCTDQQLGLPGNPVTSNNMEPGYRGHWWILDVGEQRLVIQTYCAGCDTATADSFSQTIEDITFTTTS